MDWYEKYLTKSENVSTKTFKDLHLPSLFPKIRPNSQQVEKSLMESIILLFNTFHTNTKLLVKNCLTPYLVTLSTWNMNIYFKYRTCKHLFNKSFVRWIKEQFNQCMWHFFSNFYLNNLVLERCWFHQKVLRFYYLWFDTMSLC